MICKIDNKLTIYAPTPEFEDWCKRALTLPNPDYAKKIQLGKWTGGTKPTIQLYEKRPDSIILPFGCAQSVFYRFGSDMELDNVLKPFKRLDYHSGIKLRDYQKKAVEAAMRFKNGVLVMPCGVGKTQTALQLIASVGGRALWLTHTGDLLKQSLERAKSTLGVSAKSYGTITGGKINVGETITFATVQTMAKIDLTEYKSAWDIVVVDECHKAVGSPTKMMQFYKVLSALSCRYKIGLTATPKRADGLEKSMFALLGGIICQIGKEEVAKNTCPVKVQTVYSGYMPDPDNITMGDGTIDYASLINDMVGNEERFEFVKTLIDSLDGSAIVLANRVGFLQELDKQCQIKSMCLSGMGNSKAAKRARASAIEDLKEGRLDVLFATYQLAKEGLDVPNLRYVVFATPEKDPTTVTQSAGRVGRKSDGKEYGTVVDIVDDFGMHRGWKKKRDAIYRKLGFELL